MRKTRRYVARGGRTVVRSNNKKQAISFCKMYCGANGWVFDMIEAGVIHRNGGAR